MNKYRTPLILLSFLFFCYHTTYTKERKEWTFIVYIAADNDLNYFARKNINDMKQIGSNQHINILVQLDGYGIHEKTKRFFIEKNTATQVNSDDISSHQKLNSGNAQTLIDCCQWAIEEYPAHHYALLLWNHGTGILDNVRGKAVNASEIFVFNPTTHMLDINRTINFLDFVHQKYDLEPEKGVCFSDTYGSYLTNEKLHYALHTVNTKLLNGKKIDIVAFDACLMSMIEMGTILKDSADFMVGSQEVELGTGWPYALVLEPFLYGNLSPLAFAQHMVESYAQAYQDVTNDYTQSAIDLNTLTLLETNVATVTSLLINALFYQENYSVNRAIKASRSRRLCTYFSEPSYIDLHHFYTNLLQTIEFMKLNREQESIKDSLEIALKTGCELILQTVCANKTGSSLSQARGLSIYFPTRYIDSSYPRTLFAQNTGWINLLQLMMGGQ